MLEIIFGIIMGIAHYFSESFSNKCGKHKPHIISLSAGVSVTYIFLDLFPRFIEGALQLSRFLFLFVLLGFAVLHVVEKYIYYYVPKDKLRRDLALEDSTVSFAYHFIIGIIISSFFIVDFIQGMLFFIPILLYTSLSTLPVTPPKVKGIKIILSASTLLGVLLGSFAYFTINLQVLQALLGFIIGILLFTAIRHSLPYGRGGKPLFFIIGTLGYTSLILLTWTFG